MKKEIASSQAERNDGEWRCETKNVKQGKLVDNSYISRYLHMYLCAMVIFYRKNLTKLLL